MANPNAGNAKLTKLAHDVLHVSGATSVFDKPAFACVFLPFA